MTSLALKSSHWRLLWTAAALLSAPASFLAQPPAPRPATTLAAPPITGVTQKPSLLLAPAVAQIRQTLPNLRPDKWKAPGQVTQQATSNLDSIARDLESTLPGLLATADAAPDTPSAVLPAYRNADALYDVLLRVTQVADLAAPMPQASALQQSLAALEDSRRALGDSLQTSAVNETHTVATLQSQLRAAQSATASTPAATPICSTPPAPKKRVTTRKKTTTTASAPSTAPAAPSH